MKLPNFRTALVIAGDCGPRKSVVQHLKHEGWIVHGITKAEHALPILAHIPYELIIVDCELAGIDGKSFVRLLHNAREWRAIHLVALTNCISAPLATELAHWGAFLARKEAWLDDLSHFLITLQAHTDQAKGHMYLIRTIISSYQVDSNLHRFSEIKAVDRRTSKELSLRATPASRALAIFNFRV